MENYPTATAIRRISGSLLIILTGFFCGSFGIAQVTVPNTFKPGNPIKSADVNANFKSLETAINQQSQVAGATTVSPVVVNVTCTGSGSKLQSALDALNPVAAVYEVRVTGVCSEDEIRPEGFSHLTIKSADPANPASIKKFSNSSSFYVVLQNLLIRFDGQVGQGGGECALCNFSMGRTDVADTKVECVNSGVCEIAVNVNSGEMRLYSVTRGGTWKSSGVYVRAGRQASALVSWGTNRAVCFIGDVYKAVSGGIIQYSPDTDAQRGLGCPVVRKEETTGGLVIGI